MFNLIPYVYGRRELDPFREFEKLEREIFASRRPFGFRTDVKDLGEKYVLEAELPGFKKENINVEVEDGKLTIVAERSSEKSENEENIVHRERIYGTFTRSFDVSTVQTDEITATFVDGILSLDLPKKKEEEPKTRKLEIK